MASLRSESNNARDEAREHAAKGTEAAKESAREYKGAVQSEGLAVLKGAEDRVESTKDYARQKSGEVADSAKQTKDSAVDYTREKSAAVADSAKATKDSAVDSTVRAKDSVADTASQYAGTAKEKLAGLKDGVLHSFHQTKDSANETAENVKDAAADKYNRAADYTADATQNVKDTAADKYNKAADYTQDASQRTKDTAADKYNKAADYTQDASQRTKDSAAGAYKAGEDSYGHSKDNTYTYIEEARRNLDQAAKTLTSSTHDGVDTVSQRTGETVEGAEQTIGNYAGAAKDKAAGAWDATKQKAGELTGAAQQKKEEVKDSAGRTADDLTGTAQVKKEEAKDSAGRTVDATKQKAGEVADAAGEKKEAAKETVGSTWEDTKHSVAQTWDATKQKASELTGAAQDRTDEAKDSAGSTWDATKRNAQETKEEAKDSAGSTWDATKQKASELTGGAQEKKEEAKDSAGSTWDSAKRSAGQTWDATKEKAAETRDEAADAVDSTRDRSYDAAGATKEHSASAWEQMKQKASNLLGGAQQKTNETANVAQRKADETGDRAASTWDSTKKSVSDTAQDAENKLSSTWQSTKEKTSEVADDAKNKVDDSAAHEQRRGPLIDLTGLKQKASEFLGGHHEASKPSDGGVKQAASQMLEAGKNETADTFGETQDRNALSESTAGVTHSGASHAGSVWDSTKDKSGAHEQRKGPLEGLREFFGHQQTSDNAGVKQAASQMLEAGKNETADTFGETQDRNALSESTAGVTHSGASHAGSVWDSTKDKSGAHEQSRGPLIDLQGLKEKFLGGHHDTKPTSDEQAGLKQVASQMLEAGKNETADTFGETQDRNALSESTAGVTHSGASHAGSVWDSTKDKSGHHAGGLDLNWDTIKQKASQVLESTNNEMADTVNDVADRKTLSESTLGATHAGSQVTDPTHAKTTRDDFHTPTVGIDWKEKAAQMLQSFGNETADTFDTVQDTPIVARAEDPVAAHVHDALEKAKALQREVRDEAEARHTDAHHAAAASSPAVTSGGGLSWDSLKQKATSVLDSISHASQTAADAAHEQAEKGAYDQKASATEAAMRKAADIAGVASDRASVGFSTREEPVFTSETRRATADQVADYAAK